MGGGGREGKNVDGGGTKGDGKKNSFLFCLVQYFVWSVGRGVPVERTGDTREYVDEESGRGGGRSLYPGRRRCSVLIYFAPAATTPVPPPSPLAATNAAAAVTPPSRRRRGRDP